MAVVFHWRVVVVVAVIVQIGSHIVQIGLKTFYVAKDSLELLIHPKCNN